MNVNIRWLYVSLMSLSCLHWHLPWSKHCQVRGEPASSAQERFLREAVPAWKAYSDRAKALQGEFSFQASSSHRHVTVHNTYVAKNDGVRKLLDVSMARTVDGQVDYHTYEAHLVNDDYACSIRRNSPKGDWILKDVYFPITTAPATFRSHFAGFENGAAELIMVFSEPLTDIVDRPGFRLSDCRWVRKNEETLIEVAFKIESSSTGSRGKNPIVAGTLLLDPQRSWCLRSYKLTTRSEESTGSLECQDVELGETEQGLPVPRRVVRKGVFLSADGKQTESTFVLDCKLTEPRSLPARREFTLSNFGLPEPMGAPRVKSGSRWYLWFAIAGVGCLAVSVVFRRLARSFRDKARLGDGN